MIGGDKVNTKPCQDILKINVSDPIGIALIGDTGGVG